MSRGPRREILNPHRTSMASPYYVISYPVLAKEFSHSADVTVSRIRPIVLQTSSMERFAGFS